MSLLGRRTTARRPGALWRAGLLLAAGLAPGRVQAQGVPTGFSQPGIQITVIDRSYQIQGNTAQALLDQMRMLGSGGSLARFPYRWEWSYQVRTVRTAGGVETTRCRIDGFEMRYTVDATYPRWDRPDDAPEELIAAWGAFEELLLSEWEGRRQHMVSLAREASRRTQRLEEPCPVVGQKVNTLVRDLANRPNPEERGAIGERERVPLRWPPEGFESLIPRGVSRPLPGRPVVIHYPERSFAEVAGSDVSPSSMTGVVAGRIRGGEVESLDAHGFADPEEKEPLSADAVFRFPAFTEVVVSTLAETLEREGLIHLDEPLSSYLPGLDERLGAVSLEHLLTHRSGLDDAAPRAPDWSEILDDLDDRAVFTEPGAVFSFSRYDYPLVIRALQQRMEGDLGTELTLRVFEPMGMENTSLGDPIAGLPVLLTTVPDLLQFGSAWIDSDVRGVPSASVPRSSAALLDGRGREFHGGFWRDAVGGQPRVSLMCAAGPVGDASAVEIFPDSATVLVFWSRARTADRLWPSVTAGVLLEALGSDMGVGSDILEPHWVRGDGQLEIGPRPCEEPRWTSVRADAPGLPAPAAEWAGRYLNGDREFELQGREGVLWAKAGADLEFEVTHFKEDTYFATIADRPLWPFRLVRDDLGRRYAVLGDRAHVHEADRPGG